MHIRYTIHRLLAVIAALAVVGGIAPDAVQDAPRKGTYNELVALFTEWRDFEQPALLDGAPDYTPTAMALKRQALSSWKARLAAIDPFGWPAAPLPAPAGVRSDVC